MKCKQYLEDEGMTTVFEMSKECACGTYLLLRYVSTAELKLCSWLEAEVKARMEAQINREIKEGETDGR